MHRNLTRNKAYGLPTTDQFAKIIHHHHQIYFSPKLTFLTFLIYFSNFAQVFLAFKHVILTTAPSLYKKYKAIWFLQLLLSVTFGGNILLLLFVLVENVQLVTNHVMLHNLFSLHRLTEMEIRLRTTERRSTCGSTTIFKNPDNRD